MDPRPARSWVTRLWSVFLWGGVFALLEGAAAKLADRPSLPRTPAGPELLLGLLAMIAVPLWPAVATLGARAVLAATERRWSLPVALARSLGGCARVLPVLGAPLVALMLRSPHHALSLATLGAAYFTVAAALGCLLARGAAPRGDRAAMRFITRTGLLFAFAVLFGLRAWQPELTLAPLLAPTTHLKFPFEKGRPVPQEALHPRATYPVPGLVPTPGAVGVMGGIVLLALGCCAALWRRPPAPGRREPGPPLPDIWPTVIAYAGTLGFLVLNAWLLPRMGPRPRAFAIAGDEAVMLVLMAFAIRRLADRCPGVSFWPAAASTACLAAAAVLGLDEAWLHDLPTTVTLLLSVVTFAALAASAARAMESHLEPQVWWAIWLGGSSLLAVALVLTDTLYQKIEIFEAHGVRQFFLGCWMVTKATVTVLILFVALFLPDWIKPSRVASPAAPAPAPPA